MKVRDILKFSHCITDLYYKGQYVVRCEDYNKQKDIPEWLLDSNVRIIDVDIWGEIPIMDIDSR